MTIYLLSDDRTLLAYWSKALKFHTPKILDFSSFELCKNDDIVFSSNLDLPSAFFKQCKVLILSRLPDFEASQKYLKKGAMGYTNAFMHESYFESIVHTLQENKVWLYPDFVTQLISQINLDIDKKNISSEHLNLLTTREKEVALLLIEGKSQIDIAKQLLISIRTVKAHSASIYEKLNVKDRLALAILFHP